MSRHPNNKYRACLRPPAAHVHEITRALFVLAETRGIKDEALASLAGFSASTMRKWRQGKAEPSLVSISVLAETLGLRIVLEYKEMKP